MQTKSTLVIIDESVRENPLLGKDFCKPTFIFRFVLTEEKHMRIKALPEFRVNIQ